MAKIDHLFDTLLERDGSDLHLLEGQRPKIRQYGQLINLKDEPVLNGATIQDYLKEICTEDQWKLFQKNGDLDFAYDRGESSRFRANYYFQHHGIGGVFRIIPHRILSIDDLGLPQVLKVFAQQHSGLILVTGPTGCGKSTTLAAILDYINEHYSRYILTIEEPIEFVHINKKSVFCQREVGGDVVSFSEALRSAPRQDCDVILVGEMRDYETISLAVSAASMGKLVFGTLHTNSAIKTIDRIIDVYPHDEQWKARNMVADSMHAVCAQILLKRADGSGRVAANEILINTYTLAASIREGSTANIRHTIQTGKDLGMQFMDDSISDLLAKGIIDNHEAHLKAHNKKRFRIRAEQEENLILDNVP